MRLLWSIGLGGLVACAHTPPPPSLIGGPLSAVVKQLGYPESQMEFEGDTVYRWSDGYVKTRWIVSHTKETCTVSVGVHDGKVKTIQYDGDSGPCSELQGKLDDR